ncbi:MAG: hypothetical protein WD403_08910 [Pirellulales bacterium]
MRNILCGWVMLAVASSSLTAWAQRERPRATTPKQAEGASQKETQDTSREDRIRDLVEQMREIQRELAKEGVLGVGGFGAGMGAGPGTIGPGGFRPGGDDARLDRDGRRGAAQRASQRNQQRLAGLERLIEAQANKVEALTRLHGDDSRQVSRAREELEEMRAELDELRVQPQPRYAGWAGLAGAPAAPAARLAEQYHRELMLPGAVAGGPMAGMAGGFDQAEMGQQMVIRGLEFQLEAQAAAIRAAKDEQAKQEMTEDLRKMVEQVVEARRRHTERQIERLEQRLKELNEQAENPESADEMLERLLSPQRQQRQAHPRAEQEQEEAAEEPHEEDQDEAPEDVLEEQQDRQSGLFERRNRKPVEGF